MNFGIPIDGRTIATGKFPASFNNIASARAFVNANKKYKCIEHKCKKKQ